MEKSESRGPRDRLSELPDLLILLILSLLPMRDVVRTTLMSKRCKDVWTTVPCLNFTDDTNGVSTSRNFLSRALMLWKGTKILKLDIVYHFDTPSFSDLDSWLRVANEKGAEELSRNMIDDRPMRDRGICDDTAPPSLYACSSIRNLSLLSCNLTIDDGNVHWDQLKRLQVYFVPLSEHAMNQVLSGAPQLEVLFLQLMESEEDLNIRSSSLRELTIYKHPDLASEWETNDPVRTIWAPGLEKLDISGILYTK